MPDFSQSKQFPTKAELLAWLLQNPNMASFEGWDRYGTPKLKDSASLRSWETAQKRPDYDEEIERAIYANQGGLMPSNQSVMAGNDRAAMPPLKHMPELRNPPLRGSPLKRTPEELALQEALMNRMMQWGGGGPIER